MIISNFILNILFRNYPLNTEWHWPCKFSKQSSSPSLEIKIKLSDENSYNYIQIKTQIFQIPNTEVDVNM